MQSYYIQLRRQPTIYRAIITDADKKQVEQEKVDRFISRVQYCRIDLDQEIDSRIDRIQYKESKEQYNIYRKSDTIIEKAETLQ